MPALMYPLVSRSSLGRPQLQAVSPLVRLCPGGAGREDGLAGCLSVSWLAPLPLSPRWTLVSRSPPCALSASRSGVSLGVRAAVLSLSSD